MKYGRLLGCLALLGLCSASIAAASTVKVSSRTFQHSGASTDVVAAINVTPADGVTSMDFVYTYDPALLLPAGVFGTGFTGGFSITSNLTVAGTVEIHLTGGAALAGSGDVAWVLFHVIGASGNTSSLSWVSSSLNSGAIPSATVDGSVVIQAADAVISMPDNAQGPSGGTMTVPISSTAFTNGGAFDLVIKFNEQVVNAVNVAKTSLTSCFTLVTNLTNPGQANIVLFGSCTVSGSGPLVDVTFNVVGPIGKTTPLNVIRGGINDGVPSTVLDDGLFTVCDGADGDGDGFTGCGGDCNNGNPGVYPGASDSCNAIDDDCDGSVDEGFVSSGTSCGIGACASAGTTSCVGGVVMDSCVAGSPSVESCDAIDNDCDGTVDNAAVPGGVPSLTLPAHTQLSWASVPGATAYDIVRGNIDVLNSTGGDFTAATDTCLGNFPGPTTTDASLPPGDGILWYLVRPVNCGGAGTYDSGASSQVGLRDAEIQASAGACP